MSTRVLIVDDEAPARRKLRQHLARAAQIEVVGEAGDGLAAVEAIRTLKPDLVFLDIQMPGMGGFEVIEAIGPERMPAVIFATAYDEYAIEAFDLHAVDYLLKPFGEDRFQRALERARERIVLSGRRAGSSGRESGPGGARSPIGSEAMGPSAEEADRLVRLLASVRPGASYLQRLVVRKGDRLIFVSVDEVLRLSAEGNYVKVQTATASHLLRSSLASLEQRLDPERFARIHRSEIVAIDAIAEIQSWFHGDFIVVLKNGERLRMSRRFQLALLKGVE